jgi:hypothetical protein
MQGTERKSRNRASSCGGASLVHFQPFLESYSRTLKTHQRYILLSFLVLSTFRLARFLSGHLRLLRRGRSSRSTSRSSTSTSRRRTAILRLRRRRGRCSLLLDQLDFLPQLISLQGACRGKRERGSKRECPSGIPRARRERKRKRAKR